MTQSNEPGLALENSPLAEAEVSSLRELMQEDPEKLTRRDRDRMVEHLQKDRKKFQAEEASGKKRTAVKKTDAPKNLSLADLIPPEESRGK